MTFVRSNLILGGIHYYFFCMSFFLNNEYKDEEKKKGTYEMTSENREQGRNGTSEIFESFNKSLDFISNSIKKDTELFDLSEFSRHCLFIATICRINYKENTEINIPKTFIFSLFNALSDSRLQNLFPQLLATLFYVVQANKEAACLCEENGIEEILISFLVSEESSKEQKFFALSSLNSIITGTHKDKHAESLLPIIANLYEEMKHDSSASYPISTTLLKISKFYDINGLETDIIDLAASIINEPHDINIIPCFETIKEITSANKELYHYLFGKGIISQLLALLNERINEMESNKTNQIFELVSSLLRSDVDNEMKIAALKGINLDSLCQVYSSSLSDCIVDDILTIFSSFVELLNEEAFPVFDRNDIIPILVDNLSFGSFEQKVAVLDFLLLLFDANPDYSLPLMIDNSLLSNITLLSVNDIVATKIANLLVHIFDYSSKHGQIEHVIEECNNNSAFDEIEEASNSENEEISALCKKILSYIPEE